MEVSVQYKMKKCLETVGFLSYVVHKGVWIWLDCISNKHHASNCYDFHVKGLAMKTNSTLSKCVSNIVDNFKELVECD